MEVHDVALYFVNVAWALIDTEKIDLSFHDNQNRKTQPTLKKTEKNIADNSNRQ